MRIFLVGPYYTDHSAERGIGNALDSLGIPWDVVDPRDAQRIGYNGWKDDIADLSKAADIVLVPGCCPHGPLIRDLHTSAIKVNWNAEEIRLPGYAAKVRKDASAFDFIFHFDESSLSLYPADVETAWLPLGFDPTRHHYIECKEKKEICFIGSVGGKHSYRLDFIKQLHSAGIPVSIQTCYDTEKNSLTYSRACATLNLGLTVPGDKPEDLKSYGFQQRIFEAMGSNCVVLTPLPQGWASEHNHFCKVLPNVIFFTKENIVDTCNEILNNGALRWLYKDAAAEFKSRHTYAVRIEEMIKVLKKRGFI